MAPNAALAFGIILACASVLVMAVATNLVAAGMLAVSIAFYVFIYTMWLKRRTPQNIVIGGAAGAFSAHHRLGCRDRQHRSRPRSDVRDHLLLDAAAFLVAVALRERRLRACRRAHAARGFRPPASRGLISRPIRWC